MNLETGIDALGLRLPSEVVVALARYLELLAKWNRTYNLTAIREPERMVTHHLLDSLALLPHLAGIASMVDVGSGAGLPGIPLAICRPELSLVSVESNQKKAAFQQQVKIELALANVSVHCSRVERFEGVFDAVVSRAFADLASFVAQAGHLSSRLLAMKGSYPQEEIERLPKGWHVTAVEKLMVPGLDAERHLIVLGRN